MPDDRTMRESMARHLIRLAIGVPVLAALVAAMWALVEYGNKWVMIGLFGIVTAYCTGGAVQALRRKP